ncbi:MAG: hypothetical protein ABIH41_00740 [Nanoarchaeota archaeon]
MTFAIPSRPKVLVHRGDAESCRIVRRGADATVLHDGAVLTSAARKADLVFSFQADEKFCRDAISAGISVIVGNKMDSFSMMDLSARAKDRGTFLLGPGSMGLAVPGMFCAGVFPSDLIVRGDIGVVGFSSSALVETLNEMRVAGIGQSAVVHLGSAPLQGVSLHDAITALQAHAATKVILVVSSPWQCVDPVACVGKKQMVAFVPGASGSGQGQDLGRCSSRSDLLLRFRGQRVRAFSSMWGVCAHLRSIMPK